MTKEEHIEYWLKTAKEDWETAQFLFQSKRYVYSLFFTHLTLEKTLKALWVRDNDGSIPPKTHNLVKLIQATNASLTDEQIGFLLQFNDFQLEGRYPDYKFEIHRRCDHDYSLTLLN